VAKMSSADTICLFDVDGTLTKPRQVHSTNHIVNNMHEIYIMSYS